MERKLQASILVYLSAKKAGAADPDSLDVSIGVLSEAFGISDEERMSLALPASVSLVEVFAKGLPAVEGDSTSAAAPKDEVEGEGTDVALLFR